MQIQEIMTRDAVIIGPDATIRDAAQRMRDQRVGAIPVGENDRLVGMVTDRDIVMRGVAEGRSGGDATVRDVMSEHVYYCFEDDDVENAASLMAEHQVRRVPVLNRSKRLVGMLAIADLARSGTDAVKRAVQGIAEPTGHSRS